MATLETYRRKRDFSSTSEPRGAKRSRKAGSTFVIQKHAATRLHYDLRLEMDGVLKSWAVTKGPSLVPSEKRLAVHVEDHPLEYGSFEGTIPKGEYGGGTVIVWDRGSWQAIDDPHKGYAKGHLEFELAGEKLAGRWHLVRMRGKPREKRENWLLIKGDDDAARTPADPDILTERPESVKTGRDIADVAEERPSWSSKPKKAEKKTGGKRSKNASRSLPTEPPAVPDPSSLEGAKKAPLPSFVDPALATLMATPPGGEGWIHEIKFDGYRLQARIEAGRVKLLTRSGRDWAQKFGKSLISALKSLPVGTALIDGELVVETGTGTSDFSALQDDLSAGRDDRFVFYGFDLLYLDGCDLRKLPLDARKSLLARVLATGDAGIIRYSDHFDENGDLVLRHACRLSLEGIISKLKDAPYRSGRSKSWIKSKCSTRQEFVIAGYTPSSTSRAAIGSLVLGLYEDGSLVHVGRVGTGFTQAVAEDLFTRLARLRIPESPFGKKLTAEQARSVRYVRPELVAEVEFRAWTADANLRHASFRGLREDKAASDIRREIPKGRAAARKPQRRNVKLTHPDRIYWPDDGVTKEGLADYYTEVWRSIAPHIVGRPLALLRCPTGITGNTFFQKHAWKGINKHVVRIEDPKDPTDEPLIAINDLDGLIGLVQSAVLEIHPWGSTIADWERPDRIVMDLDPGENVDWTMLIDAAQETRRRLDDAGLHAFLKTSGGKGLHVVAPLKPKADWTKVKAFTKALSDSMAADDPSRYVSTISKAKRRGKILIDYLRNQRGMTAVAPYSTRARPGAAVSMPLAWEELTTEIRSDYFTVNTAPTRLSALATDPWADFADAAKPLPISKQSRRKAR